MILADTGFWVGLLDRSDAAHPACKQFLATCNESLITTSPVLTESVHLLTRRQHHAIALRLIELLIKLQAQGLFVIFDVGQSHLQRQLELMRQYADLPMDFADASLLVLAESLGSGRIVSTDQRDFHTYRWKNHHPFTNLLMPGSG